MTKINSFISDTECQAYVYRADGSITQYPSDAILKGEDIVPGFTLLLERLF